MEAMARGSVPLRNECFKPNFLPEVGRIGSAAGTSGEDNGFWTVRRQRRRRV
jgi:hypothetical protein